MKKHLLLLLCLVLLLVSCSSSNVSSSQGGSDSSSSGGGNEVVANDMLYGMCYVQEERENYELHAETDTQLMYNMGVGSVRNWMHATSLLTSKGTVNKEACDKMHKALAEQKKLGIKIIGVNHTNFNKGTARAGKPARDISDGSYYIEWLQDYYITWKTLVKEFPEVEYWEIDNEINNSDFMKDLNGNVVYTIEQMADISADMLYYASRAIHSVNKNCKTVIGGITEPKGLGHGENVFFMEELYQNIKSGEYGYMYGLESQTKATTDPDDYFEIACWHPYLGDFNADYFVQENNKIYDVIKKYEPEGKDVFFTEIGWSDAHRTEEKTAEYLEAMFKTVKERLPYVKTVNYFKLFDVAKKTWTGSYSRFGVFYDPHNREYTRALGSDVTSLLVNGAPKPIAYAFQKVSGGSGSLTLLCEE